MKIDKRRVAIAAVPLVIGAATLFFLQGLSSHRFSAASSPSSGDASQSVPQNPAHERAALEEELKKKPDHSPILLRLAELDREAGRPAEALPRLRQVLAHEPTNEEARLELGRLLYDTGDVSGAITETKQLLADHPNQVDGLYNLGAIYANLSRNDLAREYWSKAITAAPSSESGKRARESLAQLGK